HLRNPDGICCISEIVRAVPRTALIAYSITLSARRAAWVEWVRSSAEIDYKLVHLVGMAAAEMWNGCLRRLSQWFGIRHHEDELAVVSCAISLASGSRNIDIAQKSLERCVRYTASALRNEKLSHKIRRHFGGYASRRAGVVAAFGLQAAGGRWQLSCSGDSCRSCSGAEPRVPTPASDGLEQMFTRAVFCLINCLCSF